MSWKFGAIAACAGAAVSMLAVCPLRAATAPEAAAATSARHDAVCAESAGSIIPLAVIDSSRGGFQCLGLDLDGRTIKAIRVETHSFASARDRGGSEQVDVAEFSGAVLDSTRGAVLDGVPGHDAITLRGRLAVPPGNTAFVISYLYNGFTGDFRSCEIRLDRNPNAGWRLVDRFDRTVSHIVIKTREIPLIGMFGISGLEGACS
jgi:hypothetical protein